MEALAALLTESGMPERRVAAAEWIFAEGSMGTEAYFLLEGQVHVMRRDPDGRERRVAVLEPGELFGEAAFLERTARLAGTRAATACRLIVIASDRLPDLLRRRPAVALELVRVFTGRLRVANARTLQAQLATELSSRLIAGVETESARLARDLGEGARRQLAACYRAVEHCEELASSNQSRAALELERLEEAVATLAESLSVEISVLSREEVETDALAALLRRRLTRVQLDTGLRIRLDWRTAGGAKLEPALEKALFDLVDASVSNAQSLGRAKTVQIDVHADAAEVRVRVEHDGAGYDVSRFASGEFLEAASDLDALRDRVLLVRGELQARGVAAGGTVLDARIPLGAVRS